MKIYHEYNPFKNKKGSQPPKNIIYLLLFVFILSLTVWIRACSNHSSTDNKKTAMPRVVVQAARVASVPVYLSGLGSVIPTYTVTVRTQINGRLLNVYFKEGQIVKKDELLALIDPSPYEAQLLQYQGQIERDEALLDNAKIDFERYKKLWQENSVAKQILDTQSSLVKQYGGAIKVDQGLLNAVKVNLIYTRITSPMDGLIGLRLVDPGNYVQTSDTTGIAVINNINPISVVFTLPEDYLPEIMQAIKNNYPLLVNAYDRAENHLIATGKLLSIDNQIDPTTGTVKLKAQFQNNNFVLFPNQFVNIRLLIKILPHAIVIPTTAIQNGVQNTFIYILLNNSTVHLQPIVTGVTNGNDSVITSGLTEKQLVVIDGTDKLSDGMKVTIASESESKKI